MKYIILSLLIIQIQYAFAQSETTYINQRGDIHLQGSVSTSNLETAPFNEWYEPKFESYKVDQKLAAILNDKGSDLTYKIFFGSWCGDSKKELPRLMKILSESNISQNQIELIALQGSGDFYKQGPNREEKGFKIHRVPTIICYKNQQEIGRIVEEPVTNLETDLVQIALGVPTKPRYALANAMYDLIEKLPSNEIQDSIKSYAREYQTLKNKNYELNTLGYVLLAADEVDKAINVLTMNTLLFPKEPNTWDSLGEAYIEKEDIEQAKLCFRKVMLMDDENNYTLDILDRLLSLQQ